MLLLDSEALSAIAQGPPARRDKVRALIVQMRLLELPVGTVAAVLAEVVRGRRQDAGIFAGLKGERVEVHPVDTRVGVRAGQLLGRSKAGPDLAIDAFVVAVGDLSGGALIATGDPDDFNLFASHAQDVKVADIR